MKKLLLTFTAATLLCVSAQAADVKSYQVTGPVLEVTADTITVQKGSDKWQIARGKAQLPTEVKVGSKITVQYTMTATAIDAKTTKAK